MITLSYFLRLVKTANACLLMLGLTSHVHADFQIYSVNAEPVVLTDDLPETFSYTFTATFNTFCTEGCQGYQDYILGLSDFKRSLEAGDLPLIMEDTVSVTAPDAGGFSTPKELALGTYKGTWRPESGEHVSPEQAPHEMIATYAVTLKKTALEQLYQKGEPLDFYIRGADVEGEQSYHNYYVNIPLEKPYAMKVVGLDNVVIDLSSLADGYHQQQQAFCVYASENPRTYKLSIATENNNKDVFYLAPDKAMGTDNSNLFYHVAFVAQSTSRTPWVASAGEYSVALTGGTDEACSTANIQLHTRIMSEHTGKVLQSIYKDRMYITVEPQ